jgi:hypothetical protein
VSIERKIIELSARCHGIDRCDEILIHVSESTSKLTEVNVERTGAILFPREIKIGTLVGTIEQ